MKPYQKGYALAAILIVAALGGVVVTAPDGSHFPLHSLALVVLASICAVFGVVGQYGPTGVSKYVRDHF